MKKTTPRWSEWLLSLLKGALIGTGAILPGVSGGVLCVAMGVYQPMMALLTHPLKELRARWSFFLPILLGFLAGVLLLSRGVDWLFRASPVSAIWLFLGLIVGTMPSLWREAGKQGRTRADWITAAVAFALMFSFLLLLQGGGAMELTSSVGLWLLCGVLWGVGLIAPGMSPSSLFIFMGVYQPMAAGIADMNFSILLPMGIGLLASVLLLSRGMGWLLKNAYARTMHAVLGVALASTLIIVPLSAPPAWTDLLIYIVCFAAGFAVALWMDVMNRKLDGAAA